ncbi:hypothetical protein GCM10022270_02690 [Terriglobus aquaticus]
MEMELLDTEHGVGWISWDAVEHALHAQAAAVHLDGTVVMHLEIVDRHRGVESFVKDLQEARAHHRLQVAGNAKGRQQGKTQQDHDASGDPQQQASWVTRARRQRQGGLSYGAQTGTSPELPA